MFLIFLLLAAFSTTPLIAQDDYAKNCKELLNQGYNTSGIYSIQPDDSPEQFSVYCDMETEGGGWVYFINRFDGSQDFALLWEDYKNGFGSLDAEFWLGLDYLHYLTVGILNELLVELVDWEFLKYHVSYNAFTIAGEVADYRLLLLGAYNGSRYANKFPYNAGATFNTIDHDSDISCAQSHGGGGWWYSTCTLVLPTGIYYPNGSVNADGIRWPELYWTVLDSFYDYNFKEIRMMVRPKLDQELSSFS